jgi:transposase-like protein
MSKRLTSTRQERGQAILKKESQIERIDASTYKVLSQSGNGEYVVSRSEDEWCCECPDHCFRGVKCKHIFAVEFSLEIRKEVHVHRVIQEVNIKNCQYCGSSNLKKDGVRRNKSGDIQKFYCRDCHHYFTVNIGFERMKHNPQAITSAMQLYFSGESLRNTQKSLRLLGVQVSHKTVFMWIKKYVKLMNDYVERFRPNVSDTWRADELYVKIRGDMKYVFALMDDETRFWIAQEVAENKDKHDARKLFLEAQRLMHKQPKNLITDGLQVYSVASENAYPNTNHIRHVRFQGDMNNNKMERLNGEIRDREKTMRGLKIKDTPILSGYQLFHNYIREHEGLNGKTPAEAGGIKIEGKNKWITLIQNAKKTLASQYEAY